MRHSIVFGVAWSWAAAAGPAGLIAQQPEPATRRDAPCTAASGEVRGVVRRLDEAAVPAGLAVSIGWNALMLQGLSVRTERCERTAITRDDGSFVATGVPSDESLVLVVTGTDGDVGVAVRHEAGDATTSPLTVFLPAAADVAAASEPGTGRACHTRGRVVNGNGGPVANARVRVAGSDAVRTGPQGDFDAPACGTDGTSFDIRGLNVARGDWWVSVTPTPRYWAISLDRPLPRLDAVVVTAPRREFADVTGFEQRRRSGWGRYVTRDDILRRMPAHIQYMLEGFPGLQIVGNGQVRIARNVGLSCTASVFVDGMYLQAFDLNMIDVMSVYGVEVYRGSSDTPPQFQPVGRAGCGAVVIWTRRGVERP